VKKGLMIRRRAEIWSGLARNGWQRGLSSLPSNLQPPTSTPSRPSPVISIRHPRCARPNSRRHPAPSLPTRRKPQPSARPHARTGRPSNVSQAVSSHTLGSGLSSPPTETAQQKRAVVLLLRRPIPASLRVVEGGKRRALIGRPRRCATANMPTKRAGSQEGQGRGPGRMRRSLPSRNGLNSRRAVAAE
jgi:hypothetical protein